MTASRFTLCVAFILPILGIAPVDAARAHGQDSTPAERHRLVLAELLPGVYDNVNQYYFDRRRSLPEADRHERLRKTVTRIAAPAFGEFAFLWVNRRGGDETAPRSSRIATLELGADPNVVVMRHYFPSDDEDAPPVDVSALRTQSRRSTPGCEYAFVRRAGHYAGRQRARGCSTAMRTCPASAADAPRSSSASTTSRSMTRATSPGFARRVARCTSSA